MSFIGRIAARATPTRNLVTPKGFVQRAEQPENEQEELPSQAVRRQEHEEEQPAHALRRQEQEEEVTMQTLRRQTPVGQEEEEAAQPLRRQSEEEEEEMQTLRRQSQPEQEEQEPAQALRRQAQEEEEEENLQALRRQAEEEEEPVQAVRRQEQEEEEESLQTLRRQTEEEEEEPLQTLRRQSEEEEEEMQALRRVAAGPESLEPDKVPIPEETRDEAEPPTVTALHREALTTASSGMNDFAHGDFGLIDSGIGIHAGVTDLDSTGDGFNRPSVQIDQLDVLIHEPEKTGDSSRSVDRSRSIRTRYLRRL